MRGKVICDGRGNAGTGACAAVLYVEGAVYEKAEKIEPTTNIVAEHLSIQLGIQLALDHGVTDLLIWNDSQTPVRQIAGVYATKLDHLKPLVEKTRALISQLNSFEIEWVPRSETKRPDALCRKVDRPPAARPSLVPKKPARQNPFLRRKA